MERSVDLLMKVDHLHLSDIREMRQVKRNFDIAYSTVVGIGLDAYLRKFIVFLAGGLAMRRQIIYQSPQRLYSSHWKFKCSYGTWQYFTWSLLIFFSNEIRTKLSKTLLVILQLRKKYRHKLYKLAKASCMERTKDW